MKIHKEKLIRFLLYSAFALLAFVFFLGLTFPFDLAEKQALRFLEAKTDCRLRVSQSEYGLPVTFRAHGVSGRCPRRHLGLRGAGEIEIQLKSLDLSLAPLPLLFRQAAEIDFLVGSPFGDIPGHLSLIEKAEQVSVVLRTEATQLRIDEPGFSALITIETGEGTWLNQDVIKGTGKLVFGIEKGRFKSFEGFELPIGEIAFSKIEGQVFWKDGRLVIEQFSARGDMADLQSESGVVLLRNPPENSLLTLSLRATPKGALQEMAGLFVQGYNANEPLKIGIKGTMRRPQVTMNGKALRLGF